MPLAHFQRTIVNRAGDIQPGAAVAVYDEQSGALVPIKSDREGLTGKSNPFTVGSDALADFYVTGGAYRIVATLGAFSVEWRYVPIGLLQEYDLDVLLNNRRAQVRAATTGNVTISTALNNGDTIDGVTLVTADLVLVKDQTAPEQNGIYVVGTSPARAADFDEFNDHAGAMIAVLEGDDNANTLWISSANVGGTLDTTAIPFTKVTPTLNVVAERPLHLECTPDPFPSVPHKPVVYADWSTMPWLDPGFTVTRGSAGTSQDRKGAIQTSSAGVPRFHTIYSSGDTGLLIEGSRTNILLRSRALDHTSWNKANLTVSADAVIGLDGAMSADKLVEAASTGMHALTQNVIVAADTVHTLSYLFRAGERSHFQIALYQSTSPFTGLTVNFNLATGVVVSSSPGSGITNTDASIIAYPGGWYLCSITAQLAAGVTAASCQINLQTSAGGTASYLGDGSSGLYVTEAQLEPGAFASSRIRTDSSQVTRSADVCTRSNADGFINLVEGTLFAEFVPIFDQGAGAFPGAVALSSGSSSNRHLIYQWGSDDRLYAATTNGGAAQANLSSSATITYGAAARVAYRYKADDFGASFNGAAPVTDPSGSLPTVSQMDVGSVSASPLFGIVKKVAYFQRGVTNLQLQAMAA